MQAKYQLYKGFLEPIILKLLEQQGRMYGYEITQKVKEQTKGELQITEGALYPLLHRLEANGLLEAESVKTDNRVRKYYTLTEQGKKETLQYTKLLEQFAGTLHLILQPKTS